MWENFDGNSSGRFDLFLNKVNYECFLTDSETKRLFVFFSAAGRVNSDTAFHRVSWSSGLNGVCLYIEDPMYKKYPGLQTGWFYGDENNSYLLEISKFIQKTAFARGINNEDIFFVGSSSGGYASLYVADLIKGSTAYAYNPQIKLSEWPDAKNFERFTGINLNKEDFLNRNCLKNIVENNESKFIIFVNIYSQEDQIQIFPWLESLGISNVNGIKVVGNIYFVLQEIKNKNPHNAILNLEDSLILLSFFKIKNL